MYPSASRPPETSPGEQPEPGSTSSRFVKSATTRSPFPPRTAAFEQLRVELRRIPSSKALAARLVPPSTSSMQVGRTARPLGRPWDHDGILGCKYTTTLSLRLVHGKESGALPPRRQVALRTRLAGSKPVFLRCTRSTGQLPPNQCKASQGTSRLIVDAIPRHGFRPGGAAITRATPTGARRSESVKVAR